MGNPENLIFPKVKKQCVGMHCSFTLGKTTRWTRKRMTVAAVHSFLPCPQRQVPRRNIIPAVGEIRGQTYLNALFGSPCGGSYYAAMAP